MSRKRVCIISMSVPIELDGRVLRQIAYLSRQFDITLIGYGQPQAEWQHVDWCPVDRHESRLRLVLERALLAIGRILPSAYELWLWTRPRYRQILRFARASRADSFHANDWAVVPLALDAARHGKRRVPVVYDIHEYWELEAETNQKWMTYFSPLIRYVNRTYAPRTDAATTVCGPIAKRYHDELGLNPILVYSAPVLVPIELRQTDPENIRIVHHGAARRNRHLETIVDAVALLKPQFHLIFMLVDSDNHYVDDLRRYSESVAPGRIMFRNAVPPDAIVRAIADADIGLCLIPPTTYNYLNALPNKFFESLAAGLMVCSGPSPAMTALITQYSCGVVTPDFSARGLADTLNALSAEQIETMRHAARAAAAEINADSEMSKLVALHQQLIDAQNEAAVSGD